MSSNSCHQQWLLSELVRQDPVTRGLVLGTCRYCLHLATNLHLPVTACASALYYLHRFYSVYKFGVTERKIVAGACVLLAWKVCEDSANIPTSVNTRKLSSLPRLMYRLQQCGGQSPLHDDNSSYNSSTQDESHRSTTRVTKHECKDSTTLANEEDHHVEEKCESASNWLLRTEGAEYTRMRNGLRIYETALLRALQYDTEVNLLPFQLLDTLCRKLSLTIPAKQCLHNAEMALLVRNPFIVESVETAAAPVSTISHRSNESKTATAACSSGSAGVAIVPETDGAPTVGGGKGGSVNSTTNAESPQQITTNTVLQMNDKPSTANANEKSPTRDEVVEFTFLRVVPDFDTSVPVCTTGPIGNNCGSCASSEPLGPLDSSLVQHLFVLGVSIVIDFFQSPFCLDYTATEIAIATAWKCAVALGLPVVTGKLCGDGISGTVPRFRCRRADLVHHDNVGTDGSTNSGTSQSATTSTGDGSICISKNNDVRLLHSSSVEGGRGTLIDNRGCSSSPHVNESDDSVSGNGAPVLLGVEGDSIGQHSAAPKPHGTICTEDPRCVCWEEIVESCGVASHRIHRALRDMRQVYTWLRASERDWNDISTVDADAAGGDGFKGLSGTEQLRVLRLKRLEEVYREAKRRRIRKDSCGGTSCSGGGSGSTSRRATMAQCE
eukprot:Lankesteria_metandrocarpae@DN9719_c0_g1_i1.p1